MFESSSRFAINRAGWSVTRWNYVLFVLSSQKLPILRFRISQCHVQIIPWRPHAPLETEQRIPYPMRRDAGLPKLEQTRSITLRLSQDRVFEEGTDIYFSAAGNDRISKPGNCRREYPEMVPLPPDFGEISWTVAAEEVHKTDGRLIPPWLCARFRLVTAQLRMSRRK